MKIYKRSPLALAVLALLTEAPMHPYRMQQLLKSRGKEDVINIRQRGSLYQTIDRLEREELIAAASVERTEGRPDRTVYSITGIGRQVSVEWLRDMLAEPQNDYPEFPVALSFLPLITARETLALLEARLGFLNGREKKLTADLDTFSPVLPRVLLLENEYLVATGRAERQWVEALIADLKDGTLDWTIEELKAVAARLEGEPPPKPG
jgi:DNA-binding PadR family transcriptional regulator